MTRVWFVGRHVQSSSADERLSVLYLSDTSKNDKIDMKTNPSTILIVGFFLSLKVSKSTKPCICDVMWRNVWTILQYSNKRFYNKQWRRLRINHQYPCQHVLQYSFVSPFASLKRQSRKRHSNIDPWNNKTVIIQSA